MVLDSPLFITLLCSRNSARLILLIITGIISNFVLALVATSLLNLDEDLTGDPLIIRLSCNDLHPCSIQWTEWITIQLNVKHGLVGSPPNEETVRLDDQSWKRPFTQLYLCCIIRHLISWFSTWKSIFDILIFTLNPCNCRMDVNFSVRDDRSTATGDKRSKEFLL